MHKDIHEAQAHILKELLLNNGTNFASLNKLQLSSDHFTFHIKKLIEDGLIEKSGKKYFLTQRGKEISSKLDIEFLRFERQGGPSVVVTARKVIKGKVHYLTHQRLKEPFYGYYGFVNGKIRFGETSEDAAKRELLEESGLSGKLSLLGVHHKISGPSKQKIVLDNYFFVYIVKNPKGEIQNTVEGKNFWMTKEEIIKAQLIPGVRDTVDIVFEGKYQPYYEKFIKLGKI